MLPRTPKNWTILGTVFSVAGVALSVFFFYYSGTSKPISAPTPQGPVTINSGPNNGTIVTGVGNMVINNPPAASKYTPDEAGLSQAINDKSIAGLKYLQSKGISLKGVILPQYVVESTQSLEFFVKMYQDGLIDNTVNCFGPDFGREEFLFAANLTLVRYNKKELKNRVLFLKSICNDGSTLNAMIDELN